MFRASILMQIVTAPQDRAEASSHIAGWSETVWSDAALDDAAIVKLRALCGARSRLLPAEGTVVGFRVQAATITGNRITPGGSSTGKLNMPGPDANLTDVPQMGLMMSASVTGAGNQRRFTLRGIPDFVIKGGEYNPSADYKGKVTAYCTRLVSDGWGFVGRNLAAPLVPLFNVFGAVIITTGNPGVAVNDIVRLVRARAGSDSLDPGPYRVVAFDGTSFTVDRPVHAVSALATGWMRKDSIVYRPFANVVPARAVVRKVGRPFEQYRGRASKA